MDITTKSKTLASEHIEHVCKPGRGEATCAFLMFGGDGWECAKLTDMEPLILSRRNAGALKAKGDNCEGPPTFEPTSR